MIHGRGQFGAFAKGSGGSRQMGLRRGLVGAWFPQNGTMVDRLNGNVMTAAGASVILGPMGKPAIALSGSSSSLQAPTFRAPLAQIRGGLTIAGWVRLNAAPGAGKYPAVFGQTDDYLGMNLYFDGDQGKVIPLVGQTSAWRYGMASQSFANAWVPTLGRWYFLAARAGFGRLDLWANGRVVAGDSLSGNIAQGTTNPARFGIHYGGLGTYGYGQFDYAEVFFWNRPVSNTELARIYAGESPVAPGRLNRIGSAVSGGGGGARSRIIVVNA